MKYQKYIFSLLLLIVLGFNKIVYAANENECYYQTNDVALSYNADTNKFSIDKRITTDITFRGEKLINRNKSKTDSATGITVTAVSSGCPQYIVYRHKSRFLFDSDGVWGFDNAADANKFLTASTQIKNMAAWQASAYNANGTKRTSSEYYGTLSTSPRSNTMRVDSGGTSVNVTCDELFDSELKKLINDILKYPRYLVPALVIVYGTLDFFKAVIASKEDEMKKAQKTFIKRVIMAILVFLVPVFVNAIMYLANIVWEGLGYTSCNI